ncbi:MAG TPA: DUF4129 domain-containing protein [Actinomycetales bacterium]|jgi:hypothetical protein
MSGLAAAWSSARPAPLAPSREQAQDWAERELSDPAYAQAQPGWAERLARWVLERLSEIDLPDVSAPNARLGAVLLGLLVALLVVVVLTRTGRLRLSRRVGSASAVLDDVRRTSAEHRRLADQAAADGRFEVAVRERFRAVARALEERVVLDERPGRTAHEVATEAGAALPACAAELRAGARVFDDVCYGGRRGTREHDALLRELDARVAATRPQPLTVSASGPVGG